MVYSDIKIVAERVQTENIEFYQIENFLTKYECNNLIEIMKPRLSPSRIVQNSNTNEYPDIVSSETRNSSTCYFTEQNNLIVSIVESKMSLASANDPMKGEALQGQYYTVGQEFKRHLDTFPSGDENNVHMSRGGQRTWTFMVYLNDVESGGETVFDMIPLSVKPKTGKAIFWNNLTIDSKGDKIVNNYAVHCGSPVLSGEKYILTKWYRESYCK